MSEPAPESRSSTGPTSFTPTRRALAARPDFDPQRSDVDLLVEFEPGSSLKALDHYFGLKESLEALLGRTVDLVVAGAVRNPYLRATIERDRETLYAA